MRYVALLFYLQLLPFDISESGQIILLEDSSFSGKQLSRSGSTGKGYCRLVSDASLQKMQNVWILFVVAASIVASAFIHEIAVSLSSM